MRSQEGDSQDQKPKKHCFYKEKWREGPPHSNNTHLFFGNVSKTVVLATFLRGRGAAFGDGRSKDLYPPEPLQETCLGNIPTRRSHSLAPRGSFHKC